ncbi:MAG TPA: serine hydrolase domain-containing protein [Pyrinomonadaceae bacterium]|nr:serine hydrolase domain-containing protein [Pyrinomonadaceae bacterium]
MSKAKRFLLHASLVFALLALCPGIILSEGVQPQQSGDADPAVALADYFQKAAGLGFSGSVLVSSGDKVLLRDGFGWADEQRRIPIVAETVFDIGSITKVFTAVAVMQLEERGKLSTADPITKYFSNVPKDKSAITLHHLLTHTAGLEHEDFYQEANQDIRMILTDREKFIQRILNYPLAFEPGTKRLYSNSGFSLLAAIVEKISGQSYENYLREHVLGPAGMSRTGYVIPQWKRSLVARGYNDGPTDYGFPWDTQWSGRIIPWDLLGNGGLLSTVDDLHRFVVALRDRKLLSEPAQTKMFTVYFAEKDQAYSWFISKTETGDHTFIYHGGDAVPQGWNAELRWFRDDNLIAVVLTNKRIRAGSVRRYAMNHAIDIALFRKSPQIPAFNNVTSARLRPFAGRYQLASGDSFEVRDANVAIGGGKTRAILTISGTGQQAIDLLFSGNQTAGLTKLSLDLNGRTKAYVEALQKEDLAALKNIPADTSSAEAALQSWRQFVKQRGTLRTFEILGTSPLNQAGVQTFVLLDFQKTSGVYHVTWRDQKLHLQDEDSLQPSITTFLRKSFVSYPLTVSFLPQSPSDFATYDLFKGRTINISFDNDKLIVRTKGGDVVAKKVSRIR